MPEIGQDVRIFTYAAGLLKTSSGKPDFDCELTKVLQLVNEIDPAVLYIDVMLPETVEMSLHLIFWRKEKPFNVLIINIGRTLPEGQLDFSTYAKQISESMPTGIAPVAVDPQNYTRTIEICWCTREWYFRLIEYSLKN